eukprot:5482497-Amphidinium_carterae.1
MLLAHGRPINSHRNLILSLSCSLEKGSLHSVGSLHVVGRGELQRADQPHNWRSVGLAESKESKLCVDARDPGQQTEHQKPPKERSLDMRFNVGAGPNQSNIPTFTIIVCFIVLKSQEFCTKPVAGMHVEDVQRIAIPVSYTGGAHDSASQATNEGCGLPYKTGDHTRHPKSRRKKIRGILFEYLLLCVWVNVPTLQSESKRTTDKWVNVCEELQCCQMKH